MGEISRRGFLAGAGAALTFAGMGALAACSPSGGSANGTQADASNQPAAPATKEPTQTMDCDVVVAGLGASGLFAAYGAASKGAKVIAVDSAPSMTGTTNTRTSAAFAVGSKLQTVAPEPLTIEEFMNYVNVGTNYQSNNKVLRNVIEA